MGEAGQLSSVPTLQDGSKLNSDENEDLWSIFIYVKDLKNYSDSFSFILNLFGDITSEVSSDCPCITITRWNLGENLSAQLIDYNGDPLLSLFLLDACFSFITIN